MGAIVGILGGVAGLGSLICWIMTLIKIFKDEANGGTGKGIAGFFCGIYAFIWGWQNHEAHEHKNIMLAWTGCIALNVVAQVIAGVLVSG